MDCCSSASTCLSTSQNKQKCVIAKDYLIPKIEKNVNFNKGDVILSDEVIVHIVDTLTDKEKGVRNLKRCLEIIYTKLNLYRLMKSDSTLFKEKDTIKVKKIKIKGLSECQMNAGLYFR